jgi:hypothetical protein
MRHPRTAQCRSGHTWVQLAQRVPVRLSIDKVPSGVPLVSGITATVTIRPAAESDHRNWFDRIRMDVVERLSEFFNGLPRRPNCLSAMTAQRVATERLPAENVAAALSSDHIKSLNYIDFIFVPEERNTALILPNTT